MHSDSPASWHRIYLILWPLIAVGLLFFMPLGWMFAIAAFCAGLFLLAANRRMSTLIKGAVACLWLLGLGLMMYVLTTFAALVEAADHSTADPAWTGGITVAAIAVPLAFLAAIVFLLVARPPRGEEG